MKTKCLKLKQITCPDCNKIFVFDKTYNFEIWRMRRKIFLLRATGFDKYLYASGRYKSEAITDLGLLVCDFVEIYNEQDDDKCHPGAIAAKNEFMSKIKEIKDGQETIS